MTIFRRALAGLFALFLACAPVAAQFADQATWVGNGAGSANAQTITVQNATNLADLLGVKLVYVPAATNTGPATINISGSTGSPFGAQSVRKLTNSGLQALTGFELVSGQPVMVMWDGTFIDILSAGTPVVTIAPPQGYLTPCQVSSGSPVSGCTAGQIYQTGDVVAATALYYEPAVGNQIPIYNGSVFVEQPFSELTLTIPSSRLANTIYDVFVTTTSAGAYSSTGSPTLCFGPAWTTSTAGSGARGTGAGTAQVGQTNGIWTNTVSISCVNGASTYTVPANGGTYVASTWMDGTAGQCTSHLTYGRSRKRCYWNAWNQQPIYLKAGDTTAGTFVDSSTTYQPINNNTANSLSILIGLPGQAVNLEQYLSALYNSLPVNSNAFFYPGIGYNSTSAASGYAAPVDYVIQSCAGCSNNLHFSMTAKYVTVPAIGVQTITSLDQIGSGSGSMTVTGGEAGNLLTAAWGG